MGVYEKMDASQMRLASRSDHHLISIEISEAASVAAVAVGGSGGAWIDRSIEALERGSKSDRCRRGRGGWLQGLPPIWQKKAHHFVLGIVSELLWFLLCVLMCVAVADERLGPDRLDWLDDVETRPSTYVSTHTHTLTLRLRQLARSLQSAVDRLAPQLRLDRLSKVDADHSIL